jgi:hypothetical protein
MVGTETEYDHRGVWKMLEYSERLEIRQRLWDQLDKAQTAHVAAGEWFDLLKESPAGLPQPDGALRIQQAGKDSTSTLQHYINMLKRFTDFALYGTIPEDLLPPDRPRRG